MTKRILMFLLTAVMLIGTMSVTSFALTGVAKIGDASYATLADALADVGAGDVTITLLSDATLDYNAREAYGIDATTSITIDCDGKTLTLNQKNSDWSSVGMKNAGGKLIIKNGTIEKTGYGDTSGAWNTHAIIFSCNLEMTNVTVNNSICVQNGAKLDNVTINEANGFYGLWISGNGQTVTVNGGSINATNGGRGIKIADQYIDTPAKVTLTVTGTEFNTAKKAAVLVSSEGGADITCDNVDIEGVAADSENFVWVDEEWADSYSEVTVNGGNSVLENAAENFAATLEDTDGNVTYHKTFAEAYAAAKDGEIITLLKDVKFTGKLTITKKITIDGDGHSIVADETATWYTTGSKPLYLKQYKTHLIGVNSDDVTLKNVVLDCNDNAAGINIYCAQNVTFDNVSIINATKGMAALTVNGSTLKTKTAFKALGNSIAIDISNGSGVTSDLGVTVEEGTVFDLGDKTVKFASVAVNDVTSAVKADGTTPYFVAMDNAYFYTQGQLDARTTAFANGLTLIADAAVNNKLTVKKTLDLDGNDLSVAKTLVVSGTCEGEGEIILTAKDATVEGPEGLNVVSGLTYCFVVYEDGVYSLEFDLPEALVTDIKDTLTDEDPDLTFALNFAIKDLEAILEDEEYLLALMTNYGHYYVDYVLTIEDLSDADVTFNANGDADGYLAGQYDAWSTSWVTVPFSDVTLANNESIYIMEYAASLMGQSGLRFTLAEIAQIVVDFDCGVYFTPEFLAANPDMKVTLQLKLFTEDDNKEITDETILAENVFTLEGIKAIVHAEGKQSKYLGSFAEAYEAAVEGDTITMIAEDEITEDITVQKNITVLNGEENITVADGAVLTLEAGTYDWDVNEYCGLLYIAEELTPGMFTVRMLNYVATVDGVPFEEVQDAIDAAIDGKTVVMIADDELEAGLTVPAGAVVTLDLNGHTISYASDVAGDMMLNNKGDLTITDESEDKNGKFTYAYVGTPDTSYSKGNYTIFNSGVLTLKNGTVENTTAKMSHASYAINTGAGATLNIEGGKVLYTNSHAIRIVSFGTAKNTVNISGGYIEGTRTLYIQLPGGASSTTAPEVELNITGGELVSNDAEYNLALYVYSYGQSAENVDINISGGIIKGNVALNGTATESMKEDALTVSGGDFYCEWGVFSYADDEYGIPVITITGGMFDTDYSEYYTDEDGYEFIEFNDRFRVVPKGTCVYDINVYGGVAYVNGEESDIAIAGDVVTIIADEETVYGDFYKWAELMNKADFADPTSPETTFVMPESDVTIVAVCRKYDISLDELEPNWGLIITLLRNQKYDVSASADVGGKISPEGVVEVKYGEDITFTITPDEGYKVSAVIVNGKNIGAVDEYTFENVTNDISIHVLFEELPWQNPYKDVSEEEWYYDEVAYVTEMGIMNGTSTDGDTFSPDMTVTRAMLITMLWRLEGCPVVESEAMFDDVNAGEWYSDAVAWAYENGITLGYGNGLFGTSDEITREQIITILYRYAASKDAVTNEFSAYATAIFAEATYSDWAEDAVLWADMVGIFYDIPVDQTVMTEDVIRAEIAAYFTRLCQLVLNY